MKVITIGRSKDNNDIVVDDVKVSRNHLQMVMDDQGNYSVLDLNSTNGTFVNGRRITGEVQLQVTDELKIGDTVLSWQSYFGSQPNGTNPPVPPQTPIRQNPPVPSQRPLTDPPQPKHWLVYVIVGVVVLLVGGGIGWKSYHDKQVEKRLKEEEEVKKSQEINEAKAAAAAKDADAKYAKAMQAAAEADAAAAEARAEAEEARRKAAESKSAADQQKASEKEGIAKKKEAEAKRANDEVVKLEKQVSNLKDSLSEARTAKKRAMTAQQESEVKLKLTNQMQKILNSWDDKKAESFCKKKGWPTKNARTVINDHFTNLSDNAKKQKMIDEMNGFKVNPKQAEQQTPTSSKATTTTTPPAQSASTESQPDTNKSKK